MPTNESKTNPVDTAFKEFQPLSEATEFTPVLRSLLLSLMIEEYMQFLTLISDTSSLAELEKVGNTVTNTKTASVQFTSPQVYQRFDKGATGTQMLKLHQTDCGKNYYILTSITVIEEPTKPNEN